MKLPRFDRLALISAGSLLFVGFAGCSASRTQSATGDNRPLDTSYAGNSYRRPASPFNGPQYNGSPNNPGVAPDPGYAADEYPDFRGNRKRFATGDGNPPAAQSDAELVEPSRFPADDAGSDSTDRRSFRESLHGKMSSLWHRRSSSDPADETAVQPPIAGGAAESGWNMQIDDNLVARAETENPRNAGSSASDTGLFDLDAPVEKPRRTAAVKVGVNNSPSAVPRSEGEGTALASRPVRGTSETPPEWADRRPSNPAAVAVSITRNVPPQSGGLAAGNSTNGDAALVGRTPENLTPEKLTPGKLTPAKLTPAKLTPVKLTQVAEPVRMAEPPRLSVPPSGGEREIGDETAAGLCVSRMVLCRQVRGFDDVAEISPQQLRGGQPVLVYASIDNFLSIATSKGYRTLTLSTLEIRLPEGDVVLRMPLGTAVDLAETPRQDFFLTHRVTIPENLPAGDYILSLRIDDLQAHESSRSQLAVTVTGDHTRPDAAGDTSKFAIRPDNIQR